MEEIEIRGHKYRAVESPEPGKCGDCAFKNGFGCILAEVQGDALSYCSDKHRPDGKGVYFIPAYQAENAQLSELAKKTGAPLMACKKALYVGKGDLEKAMAYLNARTWRTGLLTN